MIDDRKLFSGFPTRKQEFYYDKSIYHLIKLMTHRLLQLYKPSESEDFSHEKEVKWVKAFRKIVKTV